MTTSSLAPVVDQSRNPDADFWVRRGSDLIRYHVRPRREMFFPTDNLPVSLTQLLPERRTMQILPDQSVNIMTDSWQQGNACDSTDSSWIGSTTFQTVADTTGNTRLSVPQELLTPSSSGGACKKTSKVKISKDEPETRDHPGVQSAESPSASESSSRPTAPSLACPTFEKEQQKKRRQKLKEKGITLEVRRKKFHVEEHYDDCGTDLSGLGDHVALLADDDLGWSSSSEDEETRHFNLPWNWLCGWVGSATRYPTLNESFAALDQKPAGLDIVELCGGEARSSYIAIRRGFAAGDNFDIICNCDLNNPKNQELVMNYLVKHKPLVAIMAPTCTPYGPLSNLVRHVAPQAWQRGLNEARPHANFCGRVAQQMQLMKRYFLAEQPHPSRMWDEAEWRPAMQHPNTMKIVIHQCAAGQKTKHGHFAKKPTTFVSNSHLLLRPLTKFVCAGDHIHEPLEGGLASACRVWPWALARAIVDGCALLKTFVKQELMYPSVATGTDADKDTSVTDEDARKCPGCRGHAARDDPRHSRTPGECRWPLVQSVSWKCPGCVHHRPAAHDSHTYEAGQCKHCVIAHRQGQPRKGKHPREPARRASQMPAQDAQAQLPDGSDLAPVPEPEPNAEASGCGVPMHLRGRGREPPAEGDQPDHPADGGEQREAGRRGPDLEQRERRAYRDQDAGPANLQDWSRFDVTGSLRALRSVHPPTLDRTLRKLHLRWWHSGPSNMISMLRAAGVPEEVTSRVPNIVATCRECRQWQQRPRDTQPSVSLACSFNEIVETDLLFYKQDIIHHFVCRASRWQCAIDTPSKTEAQLLENIHTAWITHHGPMKILVVDPESGLNTDHVKATLKRQGVELHVRGKDQHARYAERRGAILRHALHVIESQAAREGMAVNFKSLLAQSVYCGNALTHVGGVTPYQVVYGRQPSCLPPLHDPSNEEPSIDGRREARIREIALQSMISASAAARIGRALHTPTSLSAEGSFSPGDLVELFRKPLSKDVSRWSGPYEVISSHPTNGVIQVKVQGRSRPYRIQDVRHAYLALAMWHHPLTSVNSAFQVLQTFIMQCKPGRLETFGCVLTRDGNQIVSRANKMWPTVTSALQFVVQNALHQCEVCTVRFGRHVQTMPRVRGPQRNILYWWEYNHAPSLATHSSDDTHVNVAQVLGSQGNNDCVMQCIINDFKSGLSLEDACQELSLDSLTDPLQTNHRDDDHADVGAESEAPTPSDNRLSTIPEGTDKGSDLATELFAAHFAEAPEHLQQELQELCAWAIHETLEETYAETHTPEPMPFYQVHETDPGRVIDPLCHYPRDVDITTYGAPSCDTDGEPCLEMYVASDMIKCFTNEGEVPHGQSLKLLIYIAKDEVKREVIQRDTDLLSPQEMINHKDLVDAATLEEFKTWVKYNCFKRLPRSKARNLIDSRFVSKWKYVEGKRVFACVLL